jgi:hypothetical protein
VGGATEARLRDSRSPDLHADQREEANPKEGEVQ